MFLLDHMRDKQYMYVCTATQPDDLNLLCGLVIFALMMSDYRLSQKLSEQTKLPQINEAIRRSDGNKTCFEESEKVRHRQKKFKKPAVQQKCIFYLSSLHNE